MFNHRPHKCAVGVRLDERFVMTDYDFSGKDQASHIEADMRATFEDLRVRLHENLVDAWIGAFRSRMTAYRHTIAIDYLDVFDFELDEYEAYLCEVSYLDELRLDDLEMLRSKRLRALEELIMEHTDVSKHAGRIKYLHQKCIEVEIFRDGHFDMVQKLLEGYRQQIDDVRSTLERGDVKDAVAMKDVVVFQMHLERLPRP